MTLVVPLLLFPLAGAQPPDLEQRMEDRFAQVQMQMQGLAQGLATLQAENGRLQAENDRLRSSALSYSTVSPSGYLEGRRLSANECCRWTPGNTCTGVAAGRFEACTMMHEYLESKTTTHEFEDLATCAGADESGWKVEFDGVAGNVTLTNGATVKSAFPTPLKVTHAASCSTVAPELQLQLNTNLAQSISLHGVDLTSRLMELNPSTRLCVKVITHNTGYVGWWVNDARTVDNTFRQISSGRFSTSSASYQTLPDIPADQRLAWVECFDDFVSFRVEGTDSDAWQGYMTGSLDGGVTWDKTFTCPLTGDAPCTGTGVISGTSQLSVDLDNSNTAATTGSKCLGSYKQCLVYLA